MKVTFWGTRGSLASPGPETARYGGNTACVSVDGGDGAVLVLDAGTGIRRLSAALPANLTRVDILLTHLHMDHIQGLGFFGPLRNSQAEVHIWGPASTALSLHRRLSRYLSPPLFPVHLRDLPCRLVLHEVAGGTFDIGPFRVSSSFVCHPDPTSGDWTSGYTLAAGADLLIHDAQYTPEEYAERVGWGHSSMQDAVAFAACAGVKHLVPFHHDPDHSDEQLDRLMEALVRSTQPPFAITAAMEGTTFSLPHEENAS